MDPMEKKEKEQTELACVYSAMMNPELSHAAFRMYVALIAAVNGRRNSHFTPISVTGLKEVVPGVRKKPLGETAFQAHLKELQLAGLIAVMTTNNPRKFLLVRLLHQGGPSRDHVRKLTKYELQPVDRPQTGGYGEFAS
jgi:hypothetical protein